MGSIGGASAMEIGSSSSSGGQAGNSWCPNVYKLNGSSLRVKGKLQGSGKINTFTVSAVDPATRISKASVSKRSGYDLVDGSPTKVDLKFTEMKGLDPSRYTYQIAIFRTGYATVSLPVTAVPAASSGGKAYTLDIGTVSVPAPVRSTPGPLP